MHESFHGGVWPLLGTSDVQSIQDLFIGKLKCGKCFLLVQVIQVHCSLKWLKCLHPEMEHIIYIYYIYFFDFFTGRWDPAKRDLNNSLDLVSGRNIRQCSGISGWSPMGRPGCCKPKVAAKVSARPSVTWISWANSAPKMETWHSADGLRFVFNFKPSTPHPRCPIPYTYGPLPLTSQ